MLSYLCIYIYIPGTCLSSIFGFEPSKRGPFPFKTRVIWVPGINICIYIYIEYTIYMYVLKCKVKHTSNFFHFQQWIPWNQSSIQIPSKSLTATWKYRRTHVGLAGPRFQTRLCQTQNVCQKPTSCQHQNEKPRSSRSQSQSSPKILIAWNNHPNSSQSQSPLQS